MKTILLCPKCKKKMKTNIYKYFKNKIIEGEMYCSSCNMLYPIKNEIVYFINKKINK